MTVVKERISQDGTRYRIVDDGNCMMPIYSVERCDVYMDDDGEACSVWLMVGNYVTPDRSLIDSYFEEVLKN